MTRIVSFRPGVTKSKTAFEAQAKIYRYLTTEYNYDFTILTSQSDTFTDDLLNVESIPPRAWKSAVPRFPVFPRRIAYRRRIDPHLDSADLLVTLDPIAYPQGGLGIRRANKTQTPIMIDASATLNGDLPLLQVLRKPFERRLLHKTDRILVTVPKVIERFRDRQLLDEEIADRFSILGHPVDTDIFAPEESMDTSESIDVLTVSRLVPEKGIQYIIEAMAPLLQEQPRLQLKILGEGPMRNYLERLAIEKCIEEQVEFLDTVPHNQVATVLNSSDIFVSHAVSNSHWEEFFGVANLEAMACELPCIVSFCGGIPYAIRENNIAKVIQQRDIVGLRKAIRSLVIDDEMRETLGRHARKYVEEYYSIEKIGSRYHHLIQETLEND